MFAAPKDWQCNWASHDWLEAEQVKWYEGPRTLIGPSRATVSPGVRWDVPGHTSPGAFGF